MDKYPLLLNGRPSGELAAEREGLYIRFTARCPLQEGLWCAWVVGERGELRLGVLEPSGNQETICRRISHRAVEPLGRLLRGEVRRNDAEPPELWEPAAEPERLFRAPWLRQRLRGVQGALTRRAGTGRRLALPYDRRKPFPLTTLFCFARIRQINGSFYVVYTFDEGERPVF